MSDQPQEETRQCRGPTCGATIRFLTKSDGRGVPVDVKPVRVWIVGRDNIARLFEGFVPHHTTCPDVGDFKRARK